MKTPSRIIFDVGFTIFITCLIIALVGLFIEQLHNIFMVFAAILGFILMGFGILMKEKNESDDY